jgi:phosphohistidine swiveling domain-containing protein
MNHGNMKNKIIELNQSWEGEQFLGAKALGLKKCFDAGLNVPNFVVLASSISEDLFLDRKIRGNYIDKVVNILQCKKYVVRSNATIEDGKNNSFAGQFLTEVNIGQNELSEKIYNVLRQAKKYLNDNLGEFSIIIQEHIDVDISGVCFTRSPNGGREMIIEYGECDGGDIVGGKISPHKTSFYWQNIPNRKLTKTFAIKDIAGDFQYIEKINHFPQDIEWGIKDNQLYILQSRAITTISDLAYKQNIFLEQWLKNGAERDKFYFEKTEISETIPRPTIFMLELLHSLYAKNGPIDKVYKKYKIVYEDTNFLEVVGNQLYVNKEKEIKSLLPAYSYLKSKKLQPKFSDVSKTFLTIKNIFYLNRSVKTSYNKLFGAVKTKIEQNKKQLNLQDAVSNLIFDYELIFEINLLYGLVIKKLELILKKEPVNIAEIIKSSAFFVDLAKYKIKPPKKMIGNSLDLSDESCFVYNQGEQGGKVYKKIEKWLEQVPEYKKRMLFKNIKQVIRYDRLREYGRWLTVKRINEIRGWLLDYAVLSNFEDSKNVYFTGLEEALGGIISEENCFKERSVYKKYNSFDLPIVISSLILEERGETIGVSYGLASGVLCTEKDIKDGKLKNKKYVLYTEILHPELVQYFDRVSGIISKNGSLLSHLAILAREKSIPVVVGFSLRESSINLGDIVQIDGRSGKISVSP